ncbi:MAG TPA: glycosyltransferase [Usitatibacter sp.]|nr:glycosyltransferase [Usitatibacter sp.]
MAAPAFSATLVTFRTPAPMLRKALESLARAIEGARAAGALSEAHVHVVDNSPAHAGAEIASVVRTWPGEAGAIALHAGHGNVGYGRANNLVLPLLRSEIHLVMNPDIELSPDALLEASRALQAQPEIGLIAPSVVGADGERQYLCRRYPSLRVLFLRGFAPGALRERHRRLIDEYEMRDALGNAQAEVPLASGCFMVVRTALLARLGGFDPRYFMYFEDYDLSLRIGREARVAYLPSAQVVHLGGDAARKGVRHVAWFLASAWRFFSRHGWKL